MSEDKKQAKIQMLVAPSAILDDGSLAEMCYDRENQWCGFLSWKDGAYTKQSTVSLGEDLRLRPLSPQNNLITHNVVLFPSGVVEYGSEETLFEEVRAFIQNYVDVSHSFELVATHYVLLSWLFDCFSALPYLRVRGDYGSGKSRFLTVLGSLCYKPIFASGASTVSPLFRLIDSIQGTLVLDESDFRLTDEKAEIVKILNNGNARGFPLLRSEVNSHKEFSPRAFLVYCPKVIATRQAFDDRALESRCLTEEMGHRRVRKGIPLSLPAAFEARALLLRNKLLMYRFRNFVSNWELGESDAGDIEARTAQVFLPLLAVSPTDVLRRDLRGYAERYAQNFKDERSASIEGLVLGVLDELRSLPQPVTVKRIANRLAQRHGGDIDRSITPRWIGSLLRHRLFLKAERIGGQFVLSQRELEKVDVLLERYGLGAGHQDIEDIERGSKEDTTA